VDQAPPQILSKRQNKRVLRQSSRRSRDNRGTRWEAIACFTWRVRE
jgi:hypothetical protein